MSELYKEIKHVKEISNQLSDIEATINKARTQADAFGLDDLEMASLGNSAGSIKANLYTNLKTLVEIDKRERMGQEGLLDPQKKKDATLAVISELRDYQTFLVQYQKLVSQLLDKEDDIEKVVAEKRQKGEKAPTEAETKDAIEEAKSNFKEAVKEGSFLSKSIETVTSFAEKAAPYVKPLIGAAKILLQLL